MALDFKVRDVMHNVIARFVHAYLPDAKKPYNLKAQYQPELDVHGVASKATVYNVQTDPKVIEEGVNAFMELVYYLVADGFRIKTPLFNLWMRLPGEYKGDEIGLNDGLYPEARLQPTAGFRQYLRDFVKLVFSGIDDDVGHIGEAIDESNGQVDTTCTQRKILTIHGHGLKIESDAAHAAAVGLFFIGATGTDSSKVESVAVNENKTLKVIVPPIGAPSTCRLKLVTQSSVKGSNHLLKEPREITSEFTLEVQ
jgi:hypothetical protein